MELPGLVFSLFLLGSLSVTTLIIISLAHSKITFLPQRFCLSDNATSEMNISAPPQQRTDKNYISSPTVQTSTLSSSFAKVVQQKSIISAKQSHCLQRLNSYLPCSHVLVLSSTLIAVFCPFYEKYLESVSIYQESTTYGLKFEPLLLFKGAEIRAFYDTIVACSTKKMYVCDNQFIQKYGSTTTRECDGYHLKGVNNFTFVSFCFSKPHLKLVTIYLHKQYTFSVFEILDLLNNLKLYIF